MNGAIVMVRIFGLHCNDIAVYESVFTFSERSPGNKKKY